MALNLNNLPLSRLEDDARTPAQILLTEGKHFNSAPGAESPYQINLYDSISSAIYYDVINAGQVTGEIKMFAGTTPPEGWLLCNGAILQTEDYPKLAAVISNTYGGNGNSTFGLPDLRGRMPIGVGIGSGLTEKTLGETGGLEEVTLTEGQLPAHDHNVRVDSNSEVAVSNEAEARVLGAGNNIYNNDPGEDAYLGGVLEDTVGSGDAVPILNPYLAINFIIFAK